MINKCQIQSINSEQSHHQLISDKKSNIVSTCDDQHDACSHLFIIHDFVSSALSHTQAAYCWRSTAAGQGRHIASDWFKPFESIYRLITPSRIIGVNYGSTCADLFYESCRQLHIADWPSYIRSLVPGVVSHEQAINLVIEKLRELARTNAFRTRIWHLQNDPIRNFQVCERFVEKLFERRSRYVVIRVDLGYLATVSDVTTGSAKRDLARFLKNAKSNRTLFGDLAGYVWKMEYGEDRRHHFHVALFFTKKNGLRAAYWAQQIGEYWCREITDGKGTYHNCHRNVYLHNGIGEVNRADQQKRAHLLRAIRYFFKAEQVLPVMPGEGRHRSFGKGFKKQQTLGRE